MTRVRAAVPDVAQPNPSGRLFGAADDRAGIGKSNFRNSPVCNRKVGRPAALHGAGAIFPVGEIALHHRGFAGRDKPLYPNVLGGERAGEAVGPYPQSTDTRIAGRR